MASVTYLDTHVLVWLYSEGRQGVPTGVAGRIEAAQGLLISPMVRLELQYLHEIGRVSEPALPVIDALAPALGLQVCNAPFYAVVQEAERHNWTRDSFDRLIVAQAALVGGELITKDETIRAQYAGAFWFD